MRHLVMVVVLFVVLMPFNAYASCDSPDNVESVSGSHHCFAIKTYTLSKKPVDTLTVVLHGDLSSGNDADYIMPVASRASAYGSIGVAMARPGYTLDGRTSSGEATRDQDFDDRYTAYQINSIAAAVANLKKHHRMKRVVMIGHSGGAIISGVILGSAAPLVDAAILVSCPCDLAGWKQRSGAESPLDHLPDVPKSSRIFALTGMNDKNTWPELARYYVNEAKKLGIDAVFHMVSFAKHKFREIGSSEEFTESLIKAIRELKRKGK